MIYNLDIFVKHCLLSSLTFILKERVGRIVWICNVFFYLTVCLWYDLQGFLCDCFDCSHWNASPLSHHFLCVN